MPGRPPNAGNGNGGGPPDNPGPPDFLFRLVPKPWLIARGIMRRLGLMETDKPAKKVAFKPAERRRPRRRKRGR